MNAIKLVLWLTFSPLQHRSHVLCLVTDKYVLKLNNSTALSNFTDVISNILSANIKNFNC